MLLEAGNLVVGAAGVECERLQSGRFASRRGGRRHGGLGVGVFAGLLALVGFTLYGPDALMTGAGAIDVGSRRAATFTAAMISGFGSLGPIVQELVIGRMYDAKGGDLTGVFALLFGSALLAATFCAVLVWRNRRNGSGV